MNRESAERKIVIVTHPNGFFGRADYGWKSLNVQFITEALGCLGRVEVVPIDELDQYPLSSFDVVIYGSSDESSLRQYYKDVLFWVNKKARLVPAIEFLMAHENKGFQELHKRELGVLSLGGRYFFDPDRAGTEPPFVLKTITGAGSSGVFLIRNDDDLLRTWGRIFRLSPKRRLINFIKRFVLAPDDYRMYGYRHKPFGLSVAQEFIPGLAGDFKVLVFGGRYFVLNRRVRDDDFRASGSGKFSFSEIPDPAVLDFSCEVSTALGAPYVSLDVAKNAGGRCALIEYQAVHFGPYTLLRSPGYFSKSDSGWEFTPQRSSIESEMARSLIEYIGRLANETASC